MAKRGEERLSGNGGIAGVVVKVLKPIDPAVAPLTQLKCLILLPDQFAVFVGIKLGESIVGCLVDFGLG